MNKEFWLTRDNHGDYSLFDNEPILCEDGIYRANNGCIAWMFMRDAGLNNGDKIKLIIG